MDIGRAELYQYCSFQSCSFPLALTPEHHLPVLLTHLSEQQSTCWMACKLALLIRAQGLALSLSQPNRTHVYCLMGLLPGKSV